MGIKGERGAIKSYIKEYMSYIHNYRINVTAKVPLTGRLGFAADFFFFFQILVEEVATEKNRLYVKSGSHIL